MFRDMPAWLISFIIHMAMLMLLALIQHKSERRAGPTDHALRHGRPRDSDGGDVIKMAQTPEAKFDLPLPEKVDLNDPAKREAMLAADQQARELRLDPNVLDTQLARSRCRERDRSAMPTACRTASLARDPRLRVEMVQREGGTTLTEAAVARSLRWFQRHQAEDGHWSLIGFKSHGKCSCGNHGGIADDTAGTALALLPYFGAGQSHWSGMYKDGSRQGACGG